MSEKLLVLAFVVGGALTLLTLIIVAFSRFYQRSTADEALVRTGAGGVRVYIGEGAFVMPVLHQLMRVSLKSIKLMVDRAGKQHALVTADRIKANVTTELYVKVEAIDESVRAAARSFGSKNLDQHAVAELIEGKLTDALRSAAANKTFNQLHQNRSEFADAIKKTLADELKHNGLILENVSITSFAMLPVNQLDPSDVFDAEGMRAITETVQLNLERTNQIKTEKANAIEAQNVIARKKSLALAQEQEQAEADQRRQVAEYGARQEAETAQAVFIQQQAKELAELEKNRAVQLARIEQEKLVQQADLARQAEVAKADATKKRTEKEAQIATEKALQAAEIAKQKDIEAANIEKQKVVQASEIERQKTLEAATIAKQQAIETATISKQIAVLKSEEEAARAAAAKALATAEEEAATQNIVTVEETAKANREKQIALIKSDEDAQRSKIAAEREAFRLRLEAETAAAAKKAAADGEIAKARGAAESLRVEAEGRAGAAVKEAEGKANAAVREAAAIATLAEANRKRGEAEAEVRRLQVEAENSVSTKLLLRDLAMKAIEVLPDVTRELMAPAQHISEIKVLQMQNGSGTDANGQSMPMGATSPVLKTILEAGAAYPLMRELMNFAQVDSGQLASKARGFLQTLPAELKSVIEQDPALSTKLANLTATESAPPVSVEIQPLAEKPVIAGPKA
jgi:uncharacterized membrane protein YqiK